MASQKPRSHLKTFLEPVPPFSQSLGPFQATATPFIPNMTTLGMSACCPEQYISRKQTPMTPPYLINYSPSNFGDPSQVLRKALLYRKFATYFFFYCMVDELSRFPSGNPSKHLISGMGTFWVYCQNNIFSGQCIFNPFSMPELGRRGPELGRRGPELGRRGRHRGPELGRRGRQSGGRECSSDLPSTRAGGQDDVSLHKLPQISMWKLLPQT